MGRTVLNNTMPAACHIRPIMASVFVLCAMRSCFVVDAEVQHSGSHSLSASGASDASFHSTMESKGTSHHWWHVASSGWWRKNRSSFYKGFMTGLTLVWFWGAVGSFSLSLVACTRLQQTSWHAKVKGGPMLPLHRLGCA